jgi:hypothetical protein
MAFNVYAEPSTILTDPATISLNEDNEVVFWENIAKVVGQSRSQQGVADCRVLDALTKTETLIVSVNSEHGFVDEMNPHVALLPFDRERIDSTSPRIASYRNFPGIQCGRDHRTEPPHSRLIPSAVRAIRICCLLA